MATTVENLGRRPVVIELDHQTFRKSAYGYRKHDVRTTELNAKVGTYVKRKHDKFLPGTLTLLGGEKKSGLPDDIIRVPDVQAHRRNGRIRITAEEEQPAKESSPQPEAKASSSAGGTSRRRRSSGGSGAGSSDNESKE